MIDGRLVQPSRADERRLLRMGDADLRMRERA